jgi:uncharacterized RDD family membrane protein YckC
MEQPGSPGREAPEAPATAQPTVPHQWTPPGQEPPPAGPAPGFAYVGFWRRFAAWFIDAILFYLIFIVLTFVFIVPAMPRLDASMYAVDPATGQLVGSEAALRDAFSGVFSGVLLAQGVLFLLWAVYNIVLWTLLSGTVGQRALGVLVRRESDGSRLGLGRAALRYLGYLVAWFPFGVGLLWVGLDPRKQGWHDKLAGTLVVRRTS